MSKIVIIGAGAMGSAFAFPCLDNNHDINIVGTHLENDFIDELKKNNNLHPGLKVEIPLGYEIQIRPRSGLAYKNGITVLNSPGTIDSDYRGEIGILVINLSSESFEIISGERIAQMVLAKHELPHFVKQNTLESSERGEGGFGSTGKK